MKKIFHTFLIVFTLFLFNRNSSFGQCSVPAGTVGVTPATYGYTIVETGTNIVFTLTPDAVSTGATLYLNGGFAGAGVPNGAGGYTWNPTLSSGSVVNFYFLFTVGGQQQTKGYTYTVGSCGGAPSTNPTASITSPVANANFIAPATIVIDATATAPPGSVITRVDFFANDGTNNISVGASFTAPYSVTWSNVPAGNYIILALATDDSTRTGSSAPVHITVSTPPSSGYCGTGTTDPTGAADYEWKAITTADSVTMIFHPVGRAVGCDLAIWNSNLGGMIMNLQSNGDLTKTVAYGANTIITFYFTYRLGAGGPETNTSAAPHSYTIGSDCSALPVTIADYDVKKSSNGSVAVTWTTLTESNSNYFKIESGFDGGHFTTLGKVSSKGNSSDKQYYAYTDNEYKGGVKYYRLSQVDKDGKTTYYAVKMVNSIKAEVEEIFPNPLKASTFYVKLKAGLNDKLNVQVVSISGKTIYSGNVTPHERLLKISLPVAPAPGMYIIKVNGNPYKLIVQ